jgi:ATP-dependent helicase/DNAse subunit B
MLHHALEHLWKNLKSLSTWLSLDAAGKEERLKNSADFAVGKMRRDRPDVLRGFMVELERIRLQSLLAEWMELESSREPFSVVSTEERVEFEFSGLSLQATIDRIDRLEDGSLAVIDYKTGSARVSDWLGDRPRDPQLPLYAVAAPKPVDSICFARLRTGEMGFFGLGREDDKIPGVKASEFASDGTLPWSERREDWRRKLQTLADQFRSGYVSVDPAEGTAVTCRYCKLESLCRIDEQDEQE